MLLNYDSWFWWMWQDFVLLALLLRLKQRAVLCARMCTENHNHVVSHSVSNHSPWGVIDGGFMKTILPKIHLFLSHPQRVLSSSKQAWVLFFLKGICIQSQHLLVLCESLHWALSKECQTLKALAEICGDSVYYFLFHSSEVLWFWDSMNKKLTKVMFRQKWDINHDRKM